MKKIFLAVVIVLAVVGLAFAQPASPPSGWKIQSGSTRALYPLMPKSYTVATLPTGTTNDVVLATDCTAADDCSSGSGTHVKLLVKTATGWTILGDGSAAGAGDVGSVGDCTSGACFDGTSDGGTYIRIYDGDSHYTALVSSNVAGNVTITLPAATGTLQTSALAETYVWVGNAGGVAAAVDSTNWDKDSTNDYVTGGTDVALADGGTGASLTDPNADRIMFWDDSAGAVTWLTVGTGLDITATTLTASGSGDVTGVGDCESGACLDGSSDGGTYVRLYDGNSHYTQIAAGDSAGNLTFTLPTAAPGGNNATVVMSTAGALSTVAQGQLPGITPAQGDVLYYNGSSWVALTAGVSGQYLQTQGAAANPQWASTAISGDIETVGDVTSGAAFAGSGGNSLQFEGATANDHEITLTAADPGEDYTITLPATTGTVLLTDGTNTDNAILRSDGTGSLAQTSGVTIDDNADIAGARNINITGDLTIQGDDLYMTTNTSGAVLVADGTNFNPVVMSGDVTIGTDGTTAIGADKVKDTMVDWGTGAGQVSLDDVTDGSSYQKVAAADVDASGHVNLLTDIDGTGAISITGPTETRAKTISDAADTIAELGQANTFTANNTFGNGDTDTLTIRSLLVGGNSRALWIAGSAPTPTYATGTNELYVAGDIETPGTVYATTFVSTSTGDSYVALANNAGGLAPSGYRIYFETDSSDVLSYSINGTEKRVANLSDAQTSTAAKTFTGGLYSGDASTAAALRLYDGSSNYWILTAPAMAGNYTLTLPADDGTSGQYLKTDGSGNTTWDTPTATAATDGGTAGVIQFNTAGAIDADASFKFTEATYTLTIGESNASSLDGNIALFNESGGTDYAVTITPGTQSADATVTLPGSTSTLATLGLAETFSGVKTFSASPILDDGSGASPSLTFQDATDETAVFSKADAGYLTITTVAGDGVQVTTGNLRVGNGSNGQTLDGEDLYVEGLVEIDGVLYADGGITAGGAFTAAAATSSIPVVVGTGTASGITAAGQMYFESDTEILTIGDGATSIGLDMAPNVVYTFPAATSTLARTDAGQTFTGVQAFTSPTIATSIVPASADGATLGSATAEFSDLFLADGGVIYFQNDQSVYLTPSAGTLTLTGALVTSGAVSPSVANGAALGSATAEWADLFLHDGAVIYGQADQSATLTSSASTWTASNFGVTGDLTVGDDLSLTSDGAVINIGAGNDVTLTHSANTLTLGGGDLALGANNLTGTGYIALGADPADTGAIRLANAAVIAFEDATEATITHVDNTGLKFNLPVILANDETISNADDTEIAFNGTESLALDLDTGTANQVAWKNKTTGSTSVDTMSFSALNLVTTGSIQGGIKIYSDADGMDAAAMTAQGVYGTLFIATGAGTWILPTAAAGMSLCLMDSGTAHDLVLDATAGDTIRLKGTEGADGATITNATGSTTGDFVCVVAVAANKWSTVGMAGTWTVP